MPSAIDTLRQDHRNMWKLLDVIETEFAQFKAGNSPDYELLSSALKYCLNYPELYHHPKEDLIYARLEERAPETLVDFGSLKTAHEALSDLTRRVSAMVQRIEEEAEVSRPAAAKLMDDFITAYRQHIRDEEQLFFPSAEEVLLAEDWAIIDAKITHIRDPFSDAKAMDYQDLRAMVLEWGMESRTSAKAC